MRIILAVILLCGTTVQVAATPPAAYMQNRDIPSIQTASPQQCAVLCQNNVTCKGWNFLPRSDHTSGVCTLKTHTVVSSIRTTTAYTSNHPAPASTRIISTRIISGGTRTLRIGTPAVTTASPTILHTNPNIRDRHAPQTSWNIPQNIGAPHTAFTSHLLDDNHEILSRPSQNIRIPLSHVLDDTPHTGTLPSPRLSPQPPMHKFTQRLPQVHIDPAHTYQSHTQEDPTQREGEFISTATVTPNSPKTHNSLFGSLHDDVDIPKTHHTLLDDSRPSMATMSEPPTLSIEQDVLPDLAGGRDNSPRR